VGGDALAAVVVPEAGSEVDWVVEPGEAHGHVGRAAPDVLGGLTRRVRHDVDQGLTDDEEPGARGHRASVEVARSKSMAL
jgi:hypothetical protein